MQEATAGIVESLFMKHLSSFEEIKVVDGSSTSFTVPLEKVVEKAILSLK